jgi:hypothetical protein
LSGESRGQLGDRPWVIGIFVIAALVGIPAGIVTVIDSVKAGQSTTSTPTNASSGDPAPWSGGSDTPRAAVTRYEVGSCLDNGARVSCEASHASEVISDGPNCGVSEFVKYAGGDPSVEIVRRTLRYAPLPKAPTSCVATFPTAVMATQQNALQSRAGDWLRLCFDSSTASEVGCNSSHSAEAVGLREGGSLQPMACDERATAYLGSPFTRYQDQLRVDREQITGGAVCWVTVLGHNVLTASVRSVGTKNLPIAASP